jgi:hypothetical protein
MQDLFGEAGSKIFFENILRLWIEPELSRRAKEGRLYRNNIETCLILMPKNQPTIIQFNEEGGFEGRLKRAPNTSFEKGQAVNVYQVVEVVTLKHPIIDEKRVAFVFIMLISNEWHIFFDFSPNGPDYIQPDDEWDWSMGKDLAAAWNLKLHEIVIESYTKEIEELKKIGMWTVPCLFPYPMSLILEKLSLKDVEGARSVLTSHCNVAFVEGLVKEWLILEPFSKRKRLIENAVTAHKEGKHDLSIYTLMPHVEGIVTEWLESMPSKDNLPKHQKDIMLKFGDLMRTNEGSFTYKHISESSLSFLLGPVLQKIEEWKNGISNNFPNRHAVEHGVYDESLFSEENSLKVILLLDTISHMIKNHSGR